MGLNGIKKERDKQLTSLETNVSKQMTNLIKNKVGDKYEPQQTTDTKHIGFEEAIKELIKLEKGE